MKNRLACAAFVAAVVSATSVSAENWEVTKLVPGSAFHGVHGLAIDKAGHLFAGSVAGAALYEVDIPGGSAKVAIPAPIGMADDIAFAPDGTMAWTGFLAGDLYSRKGDGPIKKLASGLPGINSLAFRKDGRLYATTVFLGDTLYEIDVEGVKPPRQIMEKMGGLNGFEFGPDDKLYGPLWFKGQVAKVDVDKAELTVVADGFKVPAAVNFDSKGDLWVVDTALGQLVRVDPKSGAKTMVAQLKPSLDNLAIDDKDRIYVSNMADNGIQEVDPATGQARQVIIGKLALPGGIGVTSENGKDTIHVADVFAYRTVDGATGEVTEKARMHAAGVTLEYPMSATAKGNDVVLSSWFTGTVQVIDGKTGGHPRHAARLQGAARRARARGRQHPGGRVRHQIAGPRQRRARQGSHHTDRRPRGPGRARRWIAWRGLSHRSLFRRDLDDREQRRKDSRRQGPENARRHRPRQRRQADRSGGRRQTVDRNRAGDRHGYRDRGQSSNRPRGCTRRTADAHSDRRRHRGIRHDLFLF